MIIPWAWAGRKRACGSKQRCRERRWIATLVFLHGQVAQLVERSPEKAGVGGSIPSLATTFSVVYRPLKTQVHSTSFQDPWLVGFAFTERGCVLGAVIWQRRCFGPATFVSAAESLCRGNHRHF